MDDGKELILYDINELKEVQRPIAKAIYKSKVGRPIKLTGKALPSDRIICKYCSKIYTRSNKAAHDNTKVHKIYVNLNEKVRKLLIDT